ncbi:MAG: hypothetical protein KDK12_05880 [Rhodobacteraceae bacterium]|nr:hypothetical protein [Paracoccaceae bacterium]
MKGIVSAIMLAGAALPAWAQDYQRAMQQFYQDSVLGWARDPVLIAATRAQNGTTAHYSNAQISALDQAWQAEIGSAAQPGIEPVLHNAAADFLRRQIDASGGRITEVILMDAVGLNVAVTSVTSDMWQGDEAKFIETYGHGPGAVHYGDIEFDESTGRYQGQISFTLVDPTSGEMVGAMTVGVDAELIL